MFLPGMATNPQNTKKTQHDLSTGIASPNLAASASLRHGHRFLPSIDTNPGGQSARSPTNSACAAYATASKHSTSMAYSRSPAGTAPVHSTASPGTSVTSVRCWIW